MKLKMMLLAAIILLMGGCASSEAKQFKNDKGVQKEIYDRIKQDIAEYRGLDVEPLTEDMSYEHTVPGLPVLDEDRLTVPVKTEGKPSKVIDVEILLTEEEGAKKIFGIEYDSLNELGTELLTGLFEEKHKKALKALEKQGSEIKSIRVESKLEGYKEGGLEQRDLVFELSEDYHSGKFKDLDEYYYLMDKYIERTNSEGNMDNPYILLEIPRSDESDEEILSKMEAIMEYIETSNKLPGGMYQISTESVSTDIGSHQSEFVYLDNRY